MTIGVPGLTPTAIGADRWVLPGVTVDVHSDAPPTGAPMSVQEGLEPHLPATTLRFAVTT